MHVALMRLEMVIQSAPKPPKAVAIGRGLLKQLAAEILERNDVGAIGQVVARIAERPPDALTPLKFVFSGVEMYFGPHLPDEGIQLMDSVPIDRKLAILAADVPIPASTLQPLTEAELEAIEERVARYWHGPKGQPDLDLTALKVEIIWDDAPALVAEVRRLRGILEEALIEAAKRDYRSPTTEFHRLILILEKAKT